MNFTKIAELHRDAHEASIMQTDFASRSNNLLFTHLDLHVGFYVIKYPCKLSNALLQISENEKWSTPEWHENDARGMCPVLPPVVKHRTFMNIFFSDNSGEHLSHFLVFVPAVSASSLVLE